MKNPGSSRLLMEVRAIRRLLMEVRAVRDKAAGRVEDFPGPVVSRNAAVLEKLEKNGAEKLEKY